jgi:hypothetical protein
MSRKRLTRRVAEGEDTVDLTPYPGTVNQADRKDKAPNKYDNFEHTVNHELPDLRTDWKNDTRNEIGFGIPTMASIRTAASKAVKLAVLLLGDKTPENVIEAQARDFMVLGSIGLDKALLRFAKTSSLYAADEEEVKADEVKVEDKPVAAKAKKAEDEKKDEVKADEVKVEDKPVAAKAKKAEDEKKEEVKASDDEDADDVVASDDEDADDVVASDDEDADDVVASDDEDADDKPVTAKSKAKKADQNDDAMSNNTMADDDSDLFDDDDCSCDDVVASKSKKSKCAELDVEMAAEGDTEEMEASEDDEAILANLYADENADMVAEGMDEVVPEAPVKAFKKAGKPTARKNGIKTLGGQPKLASRSADDGSELSNLWESAPDVEGLFK